MKGAAVVGIDLSGPASEHNTGVVFASIEQDHLQFREEGSGTDRDIRSLVESLLRDSRVIVGIDAPLSYQPGGGQRDRDAALRRELIAAGLRPGAVMPPTLHRMVYLTLRGVVLSRDLADAGCDVVEVHPGGTLALRGAPIADVRDYSKVDECRGRLLDRFEGAGLEGVTMADPVSSHGVAACAAALAAWGWTRGETAWRADAEPPSHPFDFVASLGDWKLVAATPEREHTVRNVRSDRTG